MKKTNAKLLEENRHLTQILEKLVNNWERQKNLFPILKKDGWMDLAVAEAKSILPAFQFDYTTDINDQDFMP